MEVQTGPVTSVWGQVFQGINLLFLGIMIVIAVVVIILVIRLIRKRHKSKVIDEKQVSPKD